MIIEDRIEIKEARAWSLLKSGILVIASGM
jgi:hypothetical protein